MVFNTSTINDVTPGYYYWYVDKWMRIINDNDFSILDKNTKNVSLTVESGSLILTDTDGSIVSIPLSDINFTDITTNISYDSTTGIITYSNELNQLQTIDIKQAVGNFETITSITVDPLNGTLTYVDENNVPQTLNLISLVKYHETVTTLVDNGDGTFTYFNEASYDEAGNLLPDATGFTFDANTLTITESENVYTFTDKSGTTLATIDTNASAITFDDTTTQLGANTV